MKKYWVIFKNEIQSSLAYKSSFFIMLFAESFSLVVFIYLWFSVYKQGDAIGNYTMGGLIFYYVMAKFINLLIQTRTGWEMGNIIRNGDISNYLVKPLSLKAEMFFGCLGTVASRVLLYSFFVILVALIFRFVFDYQAIPVFILSLAIAVIINFLIFYIVGTLTFYLGFTSGLNFLAYNLTMLFSGNFLPLDIIPKYLFTFFNYLPFKYVSYVPISILNGKIDNPLPFIFGGIAWMFALFIFSEHLFRRGLRKHEAYGL